MGPEGDMGRSHLARLSAVYSPAPSYKKSGIRIRTPDLLLYPATDVLVGHKLPARSPHKCACILEPFQLDCKVTHELGLPNDLHASCNLMTAVEDVL